MIQAGRGIQEGVDALAGYGEIFYRNVQASGVIPQISVILGPCAGGAVYSPAITDFVFMVENTAHMFITGPDVVRAVTHEDISADDLGGAAVHSQRSGVAHFTAGDEDTLLANVRYFLSFLPSNNLTPTPELSLGDDPNRQTLELRGLIPIEPQQPYDILEVIRALVDGKEFLQVQSSYATNIVVGFARLNGRTVGVIANQPEVLAGVIDINASDKSARFIRFAMPFIFLCSPWWIRPALCPVLSRKMAASSVMAPRCSMLMLRQLYPKWRSSCVKPMAVLIS
jgi:acetyl-CoA carboxylase carboxyltransferase component